MTVFSNGSPALVTSNATNSPSAPATFPTGSSPLAGHLMVAVVTAYGTTTAAFGTAPSGWVLQNSVNAASTTLTGYYLKVATGSDSAPTFTGTLTGTAADASFGVVIYDLADSSGNTPAFATDGTAAGTSGTITATTGNDVPSAGSVALGTTICSQGTTAATTTWTTPSGWNQVITAIASARSQPAYYITLPAPAAVSTLAVTFTHSRTSTEQSAIIAVFAPPPPPARSQPAGSRSSWLRAGAVQASLIVPVAAAVTLAPLYPLPGPVHAKLPAPPPKGRVHHRAGVFSGTGPAFTPLQHPARPAAASLPAPFEHGRAHHRAGPYSGTGPPVTPLQQPARSRVRATFRKGRVFSTPPYVAPVPPAAAAVPRPGQPNGVRFTLLRAGHFQALAGPWIGLNAAPLPGPVRARIPAATQRGHGGTASGLRAGVGPPAAPLRQSQAQRPRQPLPVVHGRAQTMAIYPISGVSAQPVPPLPAPVGVIVSPVRTGHQQSGPGLFAGSGPAVTPLRQPVRSRIPAVFSKGRTATATTPYVPPVVVPPLHPATIPVRARPAFPLLHGRSATRAGTYSGQGPASAPLRQPVRSRIRATFSRGRAFTTPPYVPPVPPAYAPLSPHTGPITAKQPLPVVHGRAATMAALVVSPFVIPPVYPLTGPAGIGQRAPGPQRYGRVFKTPPYVAPAVITTPVYPLAGPVRARPAFPVLHGRAEHQPGRYSGTGPAVTPPRGPVSAKLPPYSKGRARTAPPYVQPFTVPPVYPLSQPAGIGRRAPGPQLHGRVIRHAGTFSGTGPHVTPLTGPVISRRPQPARYGRGNGSRGVYGGAGPVPKAATGPVQARRPLPPRGHGGASPGTYAGQGPPPAPLRTPYKARQPLPPRGTARALAGVYSPIPPPPAVLPPLGILYLTPGSITQGGPQAAATVTGTGALLVISAVQDTAVTISPAEEGIAPVQVTPPRSADLPSPEAAVLLPDLPG